MWQSIEVDVMLTGGRETVEQPAQTRCMTVSGRHIGVGHDVVQVVDTVLENTTTHGGCTLVSCGMG